MHRYFAKRFAAFLLLFGVLLLSGCRPTVPIHLGMAGGTAEQLTLSALQVDYYQDASAFAAGAGGRAVLQGIDTLAEAEAALHTSLEGTDYALAVSSRFEDGRIAFLVCAEDQPPVYICFEDAGDGIYVDLWRSEHRRNSVDAYALPLYLVADRAVTQWGSDNLRFLLTPVEAGCSGDAAVSIRSLEDFIAAFAAYYASFTDYRVERVNNLLILDNGEASFALQFRSLAEGSRLSLTLIQDVEYARLVKDLV